MTTASHSIEPAPAAWREHLAGAHWSLPEPAQRFRSELGLPTDRPIVMTGHQCTLWHPGIFSKYAAAHAASDRFGCRAAWLWVDQDATEAGIVRAPTLEDERVGTTSWHLAGSAPPTNQPAGVADASQPSITTIADPPEHIHPLAAAGAQRIADALRAHADAPSLGAQFMAAITGTALERFAPTPAISATSLVRTAAFVELLDEMRRDPEACAEAYNAAVAEFPDAGIRPLTISDHGIELPLWRLEPGVPRRAAFDDALDADSDQINPGTLAPRALLMTALVRALGCDLFIHGTGGGSYDRVAERWFELWQSQPLAPMAVATATRTLDLLDGPVPTRRDVQVARARAHRAAHDPALLGDEDSARTKRDLVARIADAPRHSAQRHTLYREMHTLLDRVRNEHKDELEAQRAEAERVEHAHAAADLAGDRTWPAVLFPDAVLDELAGAIAAEFAIA